jgi:DNA-binding FadR family transcriptional regulator
MRAAVERGGDYVTHDLRFHQGLLRAAHNRMLAQMSKALGALLRTSFEISSTRQGATARSLPLHRAVLDAVIAHAADDAERACLKLIDGAQRDIELVLASRRRLPALGAPPLALRRPRRAERDAG